MVTAVHDISDGGLAVALTEMALAGNLGCVIEGDPDEEDIPPHGTFFGEDQGRYIVTTSPEQADEVAGKFEGARIDVRALGTVGGDTISFPQEDGISLDTLRQTHENWLPDYMTKVT